MLVLGIDLSIFEGSVSLARDGEVLSVSMWNQPRKHAEKVFIEIEKLLRDFNLSKDDIDLTVVTSGPGSFTGVRLSITVGKSLKVLGFDVKAVSTLELIGLNLVKLGVKTVSLISGRKGRFYTLLRESLESPLNVMDLTEEEVLYLLGNNEECVVAYKGEIPKKIKENSRTFHETTPLGVYCSLLPFEHPFLLKPLHFYYVRDHDARPSCKGM
ncbi:MAG: tRNA (adenosine(37)-N6)-threonylcarbamoyltransferase complex dimerization subunit type 1 TsaB [Desulfurobacteriaceae bacterium]